MNRQDVYTIIDGERDYQDKLKKGPDGRTDGQVKQVGAFLSLMQHAMSEAHKAYYGKQGDGPALEFVRKIAAMAVQCMEIHGAPPREAASPTKTALVSDNGIPRRNRIDLHTPVEMAIRQVMLSLEGMPGHPLLTEAVDLLNQAKSRVADWIESPINQEEAAKFAATELSDKLGRPGWLSAIGLGKQDGSYIIVVYMTREDRPELTFLQNGCWKDYPVKFIKNAGFAPMGSVQ